MPMGHDFEDHCWKDLVSEEMLEIYEPYQRELYVGKNPAVLVVDLYNKVYMGGPIPVREANRIQPGSCGEYAWAALPHTVRLLSAARRANIPVIYCTRHAKTRANATFRKIPGPEAEDLYHIQEQVAPESGDLVIYKERASAFFGTPLVAHLRLMGIDSLIICGEATSGCVRATAIDSFNYGFHNVVVEECTFDNTILCHKVNLFDLHHKYADVMRVDDVVVHLGSIRSVV
jgi:maleamate amidohydrolase